MVAREAMPLSVDRIVSAAEDVIRRFGPDKATVVDVARALGVSHAAVYRHVKTKASLRDLVVQKWIDTVMLPLRAITAEPGPAPVRLRRFFDTLIATKRHRAADDPELFAAYRILTADARAIVAEHVEDLVTMAASIVRAGVEDGSLRLVDPVATSRALLFATSRFHHPKHAEEWADPLSEETYAALWGMLLSGLLPQTGLEIWS